MLKTQLAMMIRDHAVFTARRPDKHRHQPHFKTGDAGIVWRDGRKFRVAKGRLIPL